MPRDGSGNYSLPSGNPVVTGTTISSTTFNNTASDIGTALSASLAANGEKVPTANLPMGGYKLTGLADGSSAADSATTGQVRDASDVGGNVLCAHKGLVITYATAATLTVTATTLVLENSSGDAIRLSSFSETPDITASGANGLDTGAEAANTWYHIWAIAKSDGTDACLLSASATAPTMPSGYTFKGYLGAVFNNSSSDFNPIKQRGNMVSSQNNTNALTNGTATSFTDCTNMGYQVPTTATAVFGVASVNVTSGTASSTLVLASEGATTTATYGQTSVQNPGGSTGALSGHFEAALTASQTLKYYVSGSNAQASVGVHGWRY